MIVKLLQRTERLLQAVWLGGLLAIGYIAAPVLFSSLDSKQLAGQLAGQMFSIMNVVGFICGGLLLLIAFYFKQGAWLKERRVWLLFAMLFIIAISVFGLQPVMQGLKAGGLVPGSEEAREFGMLHGVSSVLYMINSVLGILLVSMARPEHTNRGVARN